jgi:hypothetical protein
MADKRKFECETCGKKNELEAAGTKVPECCGKPMRAEKLPVCEMTNTAEQSRFTAKDDPCDDGRSGT